ncbi:cupredoxin domain-containing protein [Nonomuraea turcica]|uniref:cupredoxin domain-containing protein n=1 Tax=Nonomuraea sp. G32 TaxID=3067274 RepID=UPI00273B6850|nr:cupredoxin domain-containing protein [Nonomuraea sp. G32]MDP4510117.1 cupredoxin domain-containing protein [Nonomuraea sp. G32]
MLRITNRRRLALATGAAAVTLLAFSGCGGGSSAPEAPPARQATTSPAEQGRMINVTVNEFSFLIAKQDLAAGTYTFMIDNVGSAPHAMALKGPGVGTQQSDVVDGGKKTEWTVALRPGTYEVWCPVGNHRTQGMETTLTVK